MEILYLLEDFLYHSPSQIELQLPPFAIFEIYVSVYLLTFSVELIL